MQQVRKYCQAYFWLFSCEPGASATQPPNGWSKGFAFLSFNANAGFFATILAIAKQKTL
jgi:hypothetical protein